MQYFLQSKYPVILLLWGLMIISVTGCGLRKEEGPDLARLYMQSADVTDQPPVVFIHGVLGSKLRDKETKKELWMGSAWRIFTSSYDDLALTIDPETLAVTSDKVEAYAISESAIGQDFYGKIIRTIRDYGGYKLKQIGEPVNPREKNYYVFFYDWRQDNVKTSAELTKFIDQIREDYNDQNLKVDIVTHSMGGLIARYYIRYGAQDVVETNDFDQLITMYGGQRVRRIIMLGTPNLGSVRVLKIFIQGLKTGLREINTETMVTMPSLFQLFPHPLNNWIVNIKGEELKRDLFDVDTWRRFQWSIFNPKIKQRIIDSKPTIEEGEDHWRVYEAHFEKQLERARRFVWSLTVPLPAEHPRLLVFGGTCNLTPARILVEEIEGESIIRTDPKAVKNPIDGIDYNSLLLEPGDGAVTKSSLIARNTLDPNVKRHKYIFFPLKQAFFLCEKHNKLTSNKNFQDNLLHSLLSRD